MEKIRKIGKVDVLIDCNSSHDIYFDEEFTNKNNLSNGASQLDICQLLSKDEFRPLYLMWEIVDKCNFSCPFCYIVGHSNNKVVRFNEAKKSIDSLLDKGLLYCLLTGGEATIHPDFIEIYKYLKTNGVIVEVYTNGAQLTNKNFEIFSKYKPYKLEITIYGITDKVFIENTQSKFFAKNVLDNIEILKQSGVNVICKTAVNSMTATEFKSIQHWCKERNIKHYHSSDITDSYDNESLVRFVAPIDIKLKYEVENEINFINSYGNPKTGVKKSCFSCSVGSYGIHINSNFELQPCSSFNGKRKGYDIRELGIDESFEKMRNYISSVYEKPIIGCTGCDSSSHCKMCPALGEEVTHNGQIIGYKTNNNYCEKIRTNHKKIMAEVEKQTL